MSETTRPRIVVTRRLPQPVEARLAESFDAVLNAGDVPLTETALMDAMASADGLLATVTDRLDADVLTAGARRVEVIANFGVGYNHVDVAAAEAAGIVVTNTPGVLTDDTADLAIALLLMTARRAGEGERQLRAGGWGGWGPTHMMGTKVSGKTLGVVGFGRIGQAVARRAAHGFAMNVRAYSRTPIDHDALDAARARQVDSLDDLLRESDFVSIHCPATPETRHMFGPDEFRRMPSHAVLINTARGDIVDEAALVGALDAGTIAGAGLDVYEHEPSVSPALLHMENVVLLPHLGSATRDTRIAMGMRAVDNLEAFFSGKDVPDPVTRLAKRA